MLIKTAIKGKVNSRTTFDEDSSLGTMIYIATNSEGMIAHIRLQNQSK
jgi:hypothetical protein